MRCFSSALFCWHRFGQCRQKSSGLRQNPNRNPAAQRLRFGEEEQQNERALTLEKSRSKRYDACSDVEVPPRFELGVELLQSSALPLGYGTIPSILCALQRKDTL